MQYVRVMFKVINNVRDNILKVVFFDSPGTLTLHAHCTGALNGQARLVVHLSLHVFGDRYAGC